jgi:taurine dioxygenase
MHISSTETGKARVSVIPTGHALGAEICNADLRTIDDRDFADICRAWSGHLVPLFRDQELSDEDLIAFSKRFGGLDEAPFRNRGAALSRATRKSTLCRTWSKTAHP